eukprot:PhF_6_TR5489/c0_g1_i2/m.7752
MAEPAASVFCVVCGRFDRQLISRGSGLKCSECVGKKANPTFKQMQLQQAHQLLAQANPHQTVTVPHSPTQPLNQTSSTTLTTSPSQNAFTTLSSQNSSSSQAMSPKTPRSANNSEGGTAAAVVAIVEVPLDEVTVLVHDADVHELPSEVSLTMVHTVVHLSETATM